MIGGEQEIVNHLNPIFASLAPGVFILSAVLRVAEKRGGTAEQGFLYCGPRAPVILSRWFITVLSMASWRPYAEGFNLLRNANAGKRSHATDAETTPLRNPEYYQYDLDLGDIAELLRRGSVIGSWLLDLTAVALLDDPDLKNFAGRVSDFGEALDPRGCN